jgi:hypothetical protein
MHVRNSGNFKHCQQNFQFEVKFGIGRDVQNLLLPNFPSKQESQKWIFRDRLDIAAKGLVL